MPTPGSTSRLPNSFFLPARRATACSQNCRHACTAAACDGSAGSGLYVSKLTSENVGGGISWAISRSGVTLGCRSTRCATPLDPCMHAP